MDQSAIAIKILSPEKATSDKRRRFKNEISFLLRNKHKNIVTVLDYGVASGESGGSFYVMRRYRGNLPESHVRAY